MGSVLGLLGMGRQPSTGSLPRGEGHRGQGEWGRGQGGWGGVREEGGGVREGGGGVREEGVGVREHGEGVREGSGRSPREPGWGRAGFQGAEGLEQGSSRQDTRQGRALGQGGV